MQAYAEGLTFGLAWLPFSTAMVALLLAHAAITERADVSGIFRQRSVVDLCHRVGLLCL